MTRIDGPVVGGTKGWSFGTPTVDLDALGYVQEEFFLTGEAVSYRPKAGTELAFDGRWHVETRDRSPFKTRMVVIRPRDAAIFNGTVVVL